MQERLAFPDGIRSILDLGSGTGYVLQGARNLPPPVFHVGADVDFTALLQGSRKHADFTPVNARGEHLPFRDESFDAVVSHVAIPYMDLDAMARGLYRVLRPGGVFWISYHNLGYLRWRFERAISQLLWKDLVYTGYVSLNGWRVHSGSPAQPIPVGGGLPESFQTTRGLRRILEQAGFVNLEFARAPESPTWDTVAGQKPGGPFRGHIRAERRNIPLAETASSQK